VILDFPIPDGPSSVAYTTLYDYDGNGNLIYQGWAYSSPEPGPNNPGIQVSAVPQSGPVTTAPYWAIKKYTYNGSNQLTQAQWCNGNPAMENVWSNRAALSFQ
jgi:hypothetical protein